MPVGFHAHREFMVHDQGVKKIPFDSVPLPPRCSRVAETLGDKSSLQGESSVPAAPTLVAYPLHFYRGTKFEAPLPAGETS